MDIFVESEKLHVSLFGNSKNFGCTRMCRILRIGEKKFPISIEEMKEKVILFWISERVGIANLAFSVLSLLYECYRSVWSIVGAIALLLLIVETRDKGAIIIAPSVIEL